MMRKTNTRCDSMKFAIDSMPQPRPRDARWNSFAKSKRGKNLLPLSAYCLLFFRSRHAGPRWALSTLNRAHRSYGFLFVGRDDREVSFLDGAQRSVAVIRIGFVPIEARKVLLRPRLLEDFAVARINLVAHLAHVFDK